MYRFWHLHKIHVIMTIFKDATISAIPWYILQHAIYMCLQKKHTNLLEYVIPPLPPLSQKIWLSIYRKQKELPGIC